MSDTSDEDDRLGGRVESGTAPHSSPHASDLRVVYRRDITESLPKKRRHEDPKLPQLRTIKTEDSIPEPCTSSSSGGTSSSTGGSSSSDLCHSILNHQQHSTFHHHHHHPLPQTIKELHPSPANLPSGYTSNLAPSCSTQSPSGGGGGCSRPSQAPVAPKASSSAGSSTATGLGSDAIGLAAGGPNGASSFLKAEMEMNKKLRSRLEETEEKLATANASHNKLLQDLHDFVECPVCFNVPRLPPVTCCRNGHLICNRCREKCVNCPSCRTPLNSAHVSQIAAGIIERIEHPCEFRDEGCTIRLPVNEIDDHEKSCLFRLVRCPHWACDERITAMNLTHHVIASECGDNYRTKQMPYKEEMEYTRALDDEEGNGFWRPSLLEIDGITFYLQVEKLGTTRNWYFYIQMEGSSSDCENYGTTIRVSKSLENERYSTVYNGAVCPIDIKGAVEVEAHGCGLNIRDAQMEKIFVKQEEDDGEEDRFKFWIVVDIYKVNE